MLDKGRQKLIDKYPYLTIREHKIKGKMLFPTASFLFISSMKSRDNIPSSSMIARLDHKLKQS
jgi:hypothetical protein